jgi:hypothetical protein
MNTHSLDIPNDTGSLCASLLDSKLGILLLTYLIITFGDLLNLHCISIASSSNQSNT